MKTLLILITLSLWGCSESSKRLSPGLEYFPKEKLLRDGLVWKYYSHRTEKKGAQTKTDIKYIKKILDGNTFLNYTYNAGFQLVYTNRVELGDSEWKLLEDRYYNYHYLEKEEFASYDSDIKKNVLIDWKGSNGVLDKTSVLKGNGKRIISRQTENIDSIGNSGLAIKILKGTKDFIPIREDAQQDTIKILWQQQYQTGLGMTSDVTTYGETKLEMSLDEILFVSEFERRANHGTHRVAYIDTLQTLDDHTLFEPCFHPTKINDYYNDERSGFLGGKGRLRAILAEKLDAEKLVNESGFLTYRFVVNCEGEAGWFVTEEADLSYNKKEFSAECRKHLYEILKAELAWHNLIVRGRATDAYTYVTFKIKNGEIIEILP